MDKDKDNGATPAIGSSSKKPSFSRSSFTGSIRSLRVVQHLYCLRLIARIEEETAISINPATSNVDKIVAGTRARTRAS